MNDYLQVFADTDKSFYYLRRAKKYKSLGYVYMVFGVLFFAAVTSFAFPIRVCAIYAGVVCMITAFYYMNRAKVIERSVLDLTECNVTVEDDMISVHQAAENGTYETVNLFYDEIARVFAVKREPKFYVEMKDTVKDSTYFIDGQEVEDYQAVEVNGRDYDLEQFKTAYDSFIANAEHCGCRIEDQASDIRWKERKMMIDKILPALILVLPPVLYAVIYLYGGWA